MPQAVLTRFCKMESLSVANTSFALNLFSKIKETKETNNIFYSPLSISSALAMVYLGAAGNTATQMSEVLCFNKPVEPKPVQPVAVTLAQQQTQTFEIPAALQKILQQKKSTGDIHDSFNKLMSELNKAEAPYSLSLANRLYGQKTYEFVEKFLRDTKTYYNAKLETVDFQSNAEAERVKINKWVEKQTQEKIKDLLKEGNIDNSTILVLVNAIYFKGNWATQFKVENTKERPFRLNKRDTKPVQMMKQKAKFPLTFIADLRCRILEMPYNGKELSMLILLPDSIEDDTTGLEKLEQALTYENFMEWTRPDMMDRVEVEVSLPRFKLEESYDMKDLLISMGMVDAFSLDRCDFSRMSPSNNLVLSKVVHKSFVDVNEEGTEAAAATAAIMMLRCAPIPPEAFVADHPFLFFIQHTPTRSLLFCGRYSSP
ncbi:leukocyte elastase inhibitor-like isoform X2 [Neoarius graeffei]|uniref:leukocyte elastase inhibitor-like isoform X2 n=2 Tax=Neoarius graeffei TaxID=443677 RepID=UPI00298C5322|nr:leukocyte elastase inhibitor-like isoform X2 [Neoarius graeffei]